MLLLPEVEPQTVYYKRYRMEIDLQGQLGEPALPPGYSWVAWSPSLLEAHAEVKFSCFVEEIDAAVFPSLGSRQGCSYLMHEITRKSGFRPEATWLIACGEGFCGTVQGVRAASGIGAIQNLGVVPAHRGRGLGAALLLQALHGFRQTSLHRAILEVTASNSDAIRLYRRLGFRSRKTLYKAVEKGATALCPWSEPSRDWLGDSALLQPQT
ncbi:MAG: GNAT family N-acetyltransferase [Planctomycetes bacterium]|nr:GNAT family N-acetyltransferase [Planctomycetota bacterium]